MDPELEPQTHCSFGIHHHSEYPILKRIDTWTTSYGPGSTLYQSPEEDDIEHQDTI